MSSIPYINIFLCNICVTFKQTEMITPHTHTHTKKKPLKRLSWVARHRDTSKKCLILTSVFSPLYYMIYAYINLGCIIWIKFANVHICKSSSSPPSISSRKWHISRAHHQLYPTEISDCSWRRHEFREETLKMQRFHCPYQMFSCTACKWFVEGPGCQWKLWWGFVCLQYSFTKYK